jgi:transposase
MSEQEKTITSDELMVLFVTQQREILARLDRMERAQGLSVVKEAYTTEEAAERLGRSEWTVRQWCNKGQVEGAYKVHGKGRTGEWRLTHEAVSALQSRGPAPVGTHQAVAR